MADKYAYDELRVSHEQNIILPHVLNHIFWVYEALSKAELGIKYWLVSDIVAART